MEQIPKFLDNLDSAVFAILQAGHGSPRRWLPGIIAGVAVVLTAAYLALA